MSFFTSSLLPPSHQLNKNRLLYIPLRLYCDDFSEFGLNFASFTGLSTQEIDADADAVDWSAFASWMEGRGFSRKHSRQSFSYARKYVDFILRAHCFRHWFTTWLLRNGMLREYVKELREDRRQEAIGIYHHIDKQELRKAYLACIPKLGI